MSSCICRARYASLRSAGADGHVLPQGLSGGASAVATPWGLLQHRRRLMQRPQSWATLETLSGAAMRLRRHLHAPGLMGLPGTASLTARRMCLIRRLPRPEIHLGIQQHGMWPLTRGIYYIVA